MARPEKDKFPRAFYEREDGKPVSVDDAVRMKAKMTLEMRVKKLVEESETPKTPAGKTEPEKEQERIDYMRSLSPRHLGAE